jgi:hypothetical protein
VRAKLAGVAHGGLRAPTGPLQRSEGVRNRDASGEVLGRPTGEGESPVRESMSAPVGELEYHGAR